MRQRLTHRLDIGCSIEFKLRRANLTTQFIRWRVYLASMGLYTRFAAYHAVGRLIDEEWLRLARDADRMQTP